MAAPQPLPPYKELVEILPKPLPAEESLPKDLPAHKEPPENLPIKEFVLNVEEVSL